MKKRRIIGKATQLKKGGIVATINGNFVQNFYGVYDSTYGLSTKGSCETLVSRGYLSTSECDELASILGTGMGAIVTDAEKTRLREMGFSRGTIEYIAGKDGKDLFWHRLEWLRENFRGGLLWNDYSASNRADMAVELGQMEEPVVIKDLLQVYFNFRDELHRSPVLLRAVASIARYYPATSMKYVRSASDMIPSSALGRAVAIEAIESFDSVHVLTHLNGAGKCYAVDLVNRYIDKVYSVAAGGDLDAVEAIAACCDKELMPYLKKLSDEPNRDAAARARVLLKDCRQ